MNYRTQFLLDSNPLIKRYLREHSSYYKNIIRNTIFINNIIDLMKKEYNLTFSDTLTKIKDNLGMFNNIIDIIK